MNKVALAGMSLLLAGAASAGDLVQWQDNSISYLYGDNFDVDPETQHTLTFEHVSGWSMGDLFVFADFTYYDGAESYSNGKSTYYSEIAPRLSAGKILDKDLSFLFVKDVLLAAAYEFGEGGIENYLGGIGFDLEIPGFDFFQLNFYRRWEKSAYATEAYQITPVWKMSFPVGPTEIVFDGFADIVFGADNDSINLTPQLKVDVGTLLGMEKSKLMAGVEYCYWENKYGIPSEDQTVVSGLIKYHF